MNSAETNRAGVASQAAKSEHSLFPQTHWSRIDALKNAGAEQRQEALAFIAEKYWGPIYSFVRRSGVNHEEAQDLVQSFFVLALESELFAKADQQQGRFRNLLCRSIRNFLLNEWRARRAAKRSPPGGVLPLCDPNKTDGLAFDPADTRSPENAFDQAWARALLGQAAGTLGDEYRAKGMSLHFELFLDRVLNPILRKATPTPYEKLARRHQTSAKKIDTCLITARRRFSSLLRAEIQQYCRSEADVRAELEWLYEFVGQD